jgi:hypothetical protein
LEDLTRKLLVPHVGLEDCEFGGTDTPKFLLGIVAKRQGIPFSMQQHYRAMEWVEKNQDEASKIMCHENIRRWQGFPAFVSMNPLWGNGATRENVLINSNTPYVTLPTLKYQMSHSDIPEHAPLTWRRSGNDLDEFELFKIVHKWRSAPNDRRSNGRRMLTPKKQDLYGNPETIEKETLYKDKEGSKETSNHKFSFLPNAGLDPSL